MNKRKKSYLNTHTDLNKFWKKILFFLKEFNILKVIQEEIHTHQQAIFKKN